MHPPADAGPLVSIPSRPPLVGAWGGTRRISEALPAPFVALVMPVANEIATIEETYRRIRALGRDDLCWIPVLDSISQDGTRDILVQIARQDPCVKIIDLGAARGLARAYVEGYQLACRLGVERILEVDAGLSHPIERVPELIAALDDVPFVASTRIHADGGFREVPLSRRVLSRAGTFLSRTLLGIPLSDCTGGFQGFRREILEGLNLDGLLSRHHMIQTELKYLCRHLPVREIPFVYRGSDSTLRWRSIADAARVFSRLLADRIGVRRLQNPPLVRKAIGG